MYSFLNKVVARKKGIARKPASLFLMVALGGLSAILPGANAADRLFPFYPVDQALQSISVHHFDARHKAFAQALQQLDDSAVSYCEGRAKIAEVQGMQARSYLAWLELSAVVWGPLLKDNTARQIDFRPLRVNLLERAVAKAPKSQSEMAAVGSPAKGFPALEYLLYTSPAKPSSNQCDYLLAVVREIAFVTAQLDFKATDVQPGETGAAVSVNSKSKQNTGGNPDDENSTATVSSQGKAFQLYFNQLVGAVHVLAWEHIEKPVLKAREQAAAGNKGAAGTLQELPSLRAHAQWAARWKSIDSLLLVNAATAGNQAAKVVPDPTLRSVPLEAYLRGLGQVTLADELAGKAQDVRSTLHQAAPVSGAAVSLDKAQAAVLALKNLKSFLERDVATGLKVAIQFSSSDGD